MSEHDHPEPEDQSFTSPDLGPVGGEEEEQEESVEADDEMSPRERLTNLESIVELSDLKQIDGHLEFYGALIEGEEGIQRPIEELDLPPEVVEAIKSQRQVWEEAQEATRQNVATIKAALEKHSG